MFGEMAADSSMSMAFQRSRGQGQGLTAGTSSSFYNHHHHVFSFQSYPDPKLLMSPTPRPPPAPTSNATLFLSPPSSTKVPTPSLLHGLPSTPKYNFVTGSPADWTAHELKTLKEGLIRYAHEPNIMKYIKIAAMLPTRTIRDVALRCWWTPDKLAATTSVANIQMTPPNNVAPFCILMHHPSRNSLVPREGVPVLDGATQHLLEENNELLSQIAANIDAFKMEENMNLFLRTNSNIRAILKRMSETPGIMGQMPPLPVPVNEEHLKSLVQLDRGITLTRS